MPITYEEYEDLIKDFIMDNVYFDDEVEFKRNFSKNLKELYDKLW